MLVNLLSGANTLAVGATWYLELLVCGVLVVEGEGGLLAERGLEVGCMWHLRLENGWRV